ncbi:MAG TPA: DUF4331 family protein [Planctomycetota bacterium]|nr:DUF4331 family protein [Planctomycetota bacterium]
MNFRNVLATLAVALLASTIGWIGVRASDHDDGENDQKSRALNLTDLYVFREGDQTGVPTDNQNLIFIMNVNPRSVARQQYFWSTNALYEFHVTRRTTKTDPVTGADDVILRFQFGAPDLALRQQITVTAIKDGTTFSSDVRADNGMPVTTTPLQGTEPLTVAATDIHPVSLGGSTLTLFSGLREDPFFFDVEQFFRVRAGALGTGPAVGFRPTTTAVDFTAGYNVNSLVVRIPISFLQGPTTATTFDVWETILIPN